MFGGSGHVVKRKNILTFLKKERVSIAMLQETHLSATEHAKLKRDYFFIPSTYLHVVQSCAIGSVVFSDHAPVYIDIEIGKTIPKTIYWRLNRSLLNNEGFSSVIKDTLSHYWLDNQLSPVSAATIWDAATATTRGHIISQASLIKKLRIENREKLEAEVKHLELFHK
jgi:hypothetical protein